ncbi:MAG: cytosine permease [Conexivisphaerales archaeon]
MEKNAKKSTFDDYSLREVPKEQKYGMYNMFLTLSGSFGAIAVLFAGGVLGSGLNFGQSVVAVISGSIILAVIGSLTGVIGAYSGVSTYVGWRHPFGRWGGKLLGFALITVTTGIGWFAVESWFFGVVMNEIYPNSPFFSVGAAALWGGILFIISTYIGYRALSLLSYLILPQHVWLVAAGVLISVSLHGGWNKVLTAIPVQPVSLLSAITATVGLYIAGSLIAPDITRFARRPRDAVASWSLHMFVFYPFLILGAIAIVLLSGSVIITEDMLKLGMGIGVLLIILLGQWIINTVNLYSGSLSFTNFTNISRDKSSLIVGIIGTILAGYWGFVAGTSLTPFEQFITILGSLLPAAGGAVFAEFFVVSPRLKHIKDPFKRFSFEPGKSYPEINVVGILSVAIGGTFGILQSLGILLPNFGIAAVNALIISFVLYILLIYVFNAGRIKYELGEYRFIGEELK